MQKRCSWRRSKALLEAQRLCSNPLLLITTQDQHRGQHTFVDFRRDLQRILPTIVEQASSSRRNLHRQCGRRRREEIQLRTRSIDQKSVERSQQSLALKEIQPRVPTEHAASMADADAVAVDASALLTDWYTSKRAYQTAGSSSVLSSRLQAIGPTLLLYNAISGFEPQPRG